MRPPGQTVWTARDDSANFRTVKACSRVTPLNPQPAPNESLKDHLAAVNKDLAIARERLVYYEAQCARQN